MLKMILAMDLEGGIGKDGTLPWHIPEDLKRFKWLTHDSVVAMGKNTWNDPKFPKPLKDRCTIVFSKNQSDMVSKDLANSVLDFDYENIPMYLSWYDSEFTFGLDDNIWIIGGATLYNQMIHYVDEIHVTHVKDVYDCDTFFDGYTLNTDFNLVVEDDRGDYSFLTYKRA